MADPILVDITQMGGILAVFKAVDLAYKKYRQSDSGNRRESDTALSVIQKTLLEHEVKIADLNKAREKNHIDATRVEAVFATAFSDFKNEMREDLKRGRDVMDSIQNEQRSMNTRISHLEGRVK